MKSTSSTGLWKYRGKQTQLIPELLVRVSVNSKAPASALYPLPRPRGIPPPTGTRRLLGTEFLQSPGGFVQDLASTQQGQIRNPARYIHIKCDFYIKKDGCEQLKCVSNSQERQ